MVPGLPPPAPRLSDDDNIVDRIKGIFTRLVPDATQYNYNAYFSVLPHYQLAEMIEGFDDPQIEEYSDSLPDAQRCYFQTFIDVATDAFWQLVAADDADCDCAAVPDGYAAVLETAVHAQAYSDRLLAHIGGARRIKVQSRKRRTTAYAIAG